MGTAHTNFTHFLNAYLEAVWFTEEEELEQRYKELHSGEETFPRLSDMMELSNVAIRQAEHDCKKFIRLAGTYLFATGEYSQAGHDFWLTRNGHGTGFWDRDAETYGGTINNTALTRIAEKFGNVVVLVGRDGRVDFI